MCGILLLISEELTLSQITDLFNLFKENISRRGPNSFEVQDITLNSHNLLLAASVLWLQGRSLTKQPVGNETSILIYNGDLFNEVPEEILSQEGDTKYLFKLLNETDNIHDTLCRLQGPYAFIFVDKLNCKIYFGRDKFGRRSLLIGKSQNTIVFSSVAKKTKYLDFIELPSIGTFAWDFRNNRFELYPYTNVFSNKLNDLEKFLEKTFDIKHSNNLLDTPLLQPSLNSIALLNSLHNLNFDEACKVLLSDSSWFENVKKLVNLLEDAVRRRICFQPKFCKMCINKESQCYHTSVGILFSGGVDCSLLALLANHYVDKLQPIDLFNVSFDESNGFLSPDRLTGLQTFEELKELCPNRVWRFIEINVAKNELDIQRVSRIADLIYPLNTVIDDDLGCALWFASRGLNDSNCRVLLVGMGADELFGGYTKHKAAFKRESWLGLHQKLNEDWQNLPYRNLARDDRVVSDHGRQLRTPYLDENVVNFIRSLQCWEKTYPSDKVRHGFGDKILLRCTAFYLGLKKAANLKKRALQFGSRIANKKEVAHQVSKKLQ